MGSERKEKLNRSIRNGRGEEKAYFYICGIIIFTVFNFLLIGS